MATCIENIEQLQDWITNNLAEGNITLKTELTFPIKSDEEDNITDVSYVYLHTDMKTKEVYITADGVNDNLRR